MAHEAPTKDTNRYFEEIEEGETYSVDSLRTITETDIVNFAGVSSDFHPLHMSTSVAQESDFGKRIAHGNLVFSIAESLIADMNPKSFSYGYDNLRFIKPVTIDTTISVSREITAVEDYNEDYGRVVYEYKATNEDDDTVLTCEHITLIEKRETE